MKPSKSSLLMIVQLVSSIQDKIYLMECQASLDITGSFNQQDIHLGEFNPEVMALT